jgi:hypothetical protein
MADGEATRKVTLTFGGDAFAHGRVPLTLLAEKLKALQSLMFHAAATVSRDKVARRGQWANRYRDAVELSFVDSHHSDLVIEAELPAIAPTLADDFDLGKQSLGLAYDFADAISRADVQKLMQLAPDRQERTLLIRAVESLAPDPAENYAITFANGSAQRPGVRLTGSSRLVARMLHLQGALAEAESAREVTIVGTLTKIHYDVAPQKIAVRVDPGNEVDCFYDDALREQVTNLCVGGIVEVGGTALFDVEGRVKQIDAVAGIEAVSMEPVRISRFEHGGRTYRLAEAVPFAVEFSEGVWVYSNETLGIRGYAFKRDEALKELHEAFDFAYREIGLANEDEVIGKASDMRRELLRLVQPQPGGGGH